MTLLSAITWHQNTIIQHLFRIVIRLQDTFFSTEGHRTWASTHSALLWQETRQVSMKRFLKMRFPSFFRGGNFAAVLTMRYASEQVTENRPRLQVLIYPILQFFDFTLPSYQEEHCEVYPYATEHVLSLYINQKIDKSILQNNHTSGQQKDQYRRFVDRSLIRPEFLRKKRNPVAECREGAPDLVQRASIALQPAISPLLVEDSQLAKLPLTYVLTVGHDRLRDESLIYVERLRNCRVRVFHKHYEDAFHASITSLYGITRLNIAHEMVHGIVDFLKHNL
jgi:arylacetamide deacetylase-like 2